ncbi:CHAP domain-containing protein [Pyxidicoccus caerfyrddinensis]|uniref:CHAP domain-containing protein n=1 Tax=Pyxidicoccus caerfyrddinensis TaxID=2709663 RepID=UPI0013DBA335|nr:CHAP domain-containing protein [Pyxidicoccus caerfyrddinensis]
MRSVALMGILAVMATGCAATRAPLEPWLDSYSLRYRSASPPAFPRESLSSPVVAEQPARAPSRMTVSSGKTRTKPVASRAPKPVATKPAVTPARATESATPRETVLATARALVGKSQVVLNGRKYPADCTGLIEGVYAQAGVNFRGTLKPGDNGVTALYRHARARGRVYTEGRPVPGDLVFFRETYDQNRDGRRNDGLTHVGIVDAVDTDGTVTVIHRVRRGVVRYQMNLARPHLPRNPKTGEVLNDYLRHPGPNREPVLTGQLFASFGSVLPAVPAKTKPVPVALR